MKIGIEINGVLRDTVGKFKMCYEKYMVNEDPENVNLKTFKIDFSGDTQSETELNNDSFKYEIKSDITTLELINHFSFKSQEEFYEFMYEEFPMEIFGHSMSSEINSFSILNDFYLKNRDLHEIYLISDEIGKSKPATLFFLSKFSSLIEGVLFYNDKTKNNILSNFDLIVTSNPNLIIDYRNRLNIIKFETQYNKDINHYSEIKSLSELEKEIKKINVKII